MTARPKVRTNLVIACWSGQRRHENSILLDKVPYPDTGLAHLKKQKGLLTKLQHTLSQITLVMSHDPNCPIDYRAFIQDFPDRIRYAPVVKMFRPDNVGISYGAWAHAVDVFRERFDYYIFIEDDYCFVKDNFDSKLVNMYESCGCEFMLAYEKNDIFVTNGIVGSQHLAKLNWTWPMGNTHTDSAYNKGDMRCFVDSFKTCMFKPPYTASPFFGVHREPGIILFGEGDFLLAPTQIIHPDTFEVHLPPTVRSYEF